MKLATGAFLADYSYDLRSRLKDGMMGNTSLVTFGYNADSELTSLEYAIGDETGAPESLAWGHGYTPAGRLQSTNLLDPQQPSWAPATARQVSYGSANVLDQYEAVSDRGALSYDARGNLTGDGSRSYSYDLMNRLIGANVNGTAIRYDYDTSGRRVGKTVDGVETRFVHAGDMEIGEYDSSGALLRRYIPGGAVDARVAMIEGSGSCAIGSSSCPDANGFAPEDIRYYHADRLGNVAALTDSDGRVTDRYAYDPFGNEIAGASTSGNPFRYTGKNMVILPFLGGASVEFKLLSISVSGSYLRCPCLVCRCCKSRANGWHGLTPLGCC